eukprot:416860_1
MQFYEKIEVDFDFDCEDIEKMKNSALVRTNTALGKQITCLYRLVNELKVKQLSDTLKPFANVSKIECRFNGYLNIPHWNCPKVTKWNYDKNGVLRIFCTEDIIIHTNSIITVKGCGLPIEFEHKNDYCLQYGSGYTTNNKSRGGGIIELISLKNIINYGLICADGI